MKKTTYIIGIMAGIGTWLALLADMEAIQYMLAFVCLTALWLGDRTRSRAKDID